MSDDLKPMPPRPRPGDDRLTKGEVRAMWILAFTLTIPALMALGFIAMSLVYAGEQWLPSPQEMIEIIP